MMTPVTCNKILKSKDLLKSSVIYKTKSIMNLFRNLLDQVVALKKKIEKLNQEIECQS
jgi:hypothetical protein